MENINKIEIGSILDKLTPITKYEEKIILAEAKAKKNRIHELELKKQHVFESSGVPRRYWNDSFETYLPRNEEDKERLQIIKKFSELEKNDEVLLMLGSKGLGKTHLGASIIRECGGKFISIEELIFKYEVSNDFKAKINREDLMEYYSTVEMLVVDEIGRSLEQDKENALLNYLLRRRYENMLPTVLISNLSKTELMKKLGDAVVDRLKEICIAVEFVGESYRLSKRNVKF